MKRSFKQTKENLKIIKERVLEYVNSKPQPCSIRYSTNRASRPETLKEKEAIRNFISNGKHIRNLNHLITVAIVELQKEGRLKRVIQIGREHSLPFLYTTIMEDKEMKGMECNILLEDCEKCEILNRTLENYTKLFQDKINETFMLKEKEYLEQLEKALEADRGKHSGRWNELLQALTNKEEEFKQLSEQCVEHMKTISHYQNVVMDRDVEIKLLKESLRISNINVVNLTSDREVLQQENKKLEDDNANMQKILKAQREDRFVTKSKKIAEEFMGKLDFSGATIKIDGNGKLIKLK